MLVSSTGLCKVLTLLCLVCIAAIVYLLPERYVSDPSSVLDRIWNGRTDRIMEDSGYQDLVKQYMHLNRLRNGKPSIVFLGDSITRGFILQEYLGDLPLLNRGIDSDTTLGVLNRIETTVNTLNVTTLFLMIGHNDLAYRTDDAIVENIASIISKLRSRKVYLQSILPVEKSRRGDNERILRINKRIEGLCATGSCAYVNLHRYFVDHTGHANLAYFRDGVHPSAAGYALWAGVIDLLVK